MPEPQRRMDTYEPSDMALPTWNLLQKTGGDWAKSLGGKPGQFHNTSSDELADELNIIVVDVLMGRAKWGSEITSSGPICASMDAKSMKSIDGVDCSRCLDRLDTPWNVDASGRRTKCCLNYTILAIDLSDYMPCLIRAHGVSALPVRQLLTQLRMNRALKGDYFRAVVNIKAQEKATKYGSTFALHPKITELITDEARARELKAESQKLLGAPIPLPEARPEEEVVAYTPEGKPIYSEEEKTRAAAQEAARVNLSPPGKKEEAPPIEAQQKKPTVVKPEPPKEEKKESTETAPDLDF